MQVGKTGVRSYIKEPVITFRNRGRLRAERFAASHFEHTSVKETI